MNFDTAEKTYEPRPRLSGILLHPTSLPSPYGIGDLGEEAYAWIDFLKQSGQRLWQILPLTSTGKGNSPYQSFSAFAGQPLLISPSHLIRLKLLTEADLSPMPDWNPERIDYSSLIPWKEALLKKAYENYLHTTDKMLMEEYESFLERNRFWVEDYALYMACRDKNGQTCWTDWEAPYRRPDAAEKDGLKKLLEKETGYYQFIQFMFYKEWYALKDYANDNGIQIIGDIPIFVSLDSADVWANPELFQLDDEGYPEVVSGVPPDYFSSTGQMWGNPLYDWNAHKKTGYAWWINRIKNQLDVTDYVRIDHFRGFEACWAIPADAENALAGSWQTGPREDLFLAVEQKLGKGLPIIAEDLGLITPEVEKLRDRFHLPGMRILQFAFESDGESTYLPHQFTTTNCVCYTGTHDNNTSAGWYQNAGERQRDKVRRYMNTDGGAVHFDFIRTCLGSIAAFAIFPMQDVLGLGEDARMNIPGVPDGNWEWRYKKEALNSGLAGYLCSLTHLYGR